MGLLIYHQEYQTTHISTGFVSVAISGGFCENRARLTGLEMAFEICIRLSKWSHIFHRYDHTNNTRRGVIYLAQINQLPVDAIQQFQRGNCVVNK